MTFFRSRWVEAPAHVTELDPHALPAGFRAAGVAAGIKPEGLDVGVVVSDEPDTVSAARFTTNARVGAPVIVSREARLDGLRAVAANSGCSNVGDGERGLETAARDAGGGRRGAGHRAGPGGGRLDRRDRRGAAAREGGERRARRMRRAGRRRGRLLARDPHQRRRPQAGLPRGGAAGREGAARGAGQGRRDDLAALRHDVLLRPDRRRARRGDARPPHGRVREALVRPDQRRRPALDERHGGRAGERRLRRAGRTGVGGRAGAWARRSTPCCASSRSRSCTTGRGRGAWAGSW